MKLQIFLDAVLAGRRLERSRTLKYWTVAN